MYSCCFLHKEYFLLFNNCEGKGGCVAKISVDPVVPLLKKNLFTQHASLICEHPRALKRSSNGPTILWRPTQLLAVNLT